MQAYSNMYYHWGWVVVSFAGFVVGIWAGFTRKWYAFFLWLVAVAALGGLAFKYKEGIYE